MIGIQKHRAKFVNNRSLLTCANIDRHTQQFENFVSNSIKNMTCFPELNHGQSTLKEPMENGRSRCIGISFSTYWNKTRTQLWMLQDDTLRFLRIGINNALTKNYKNVLSSGEYGKPLHTTAENISSYSPPIPLWRSVRFRTRTPIKHVLEMNGTTNKNDR
mmetsp:Transcript_3936/g.4064  ORF Transcript_3936/g.4064 Transcript_3936/m.4064 type:complete len:161 (+) Transcript_3936:617-1099(+)